MKKLLIKFAMWILKDRIIKIESTQIVTNELLRNAISLDWVMLEVKRKLRNNLIDEVFKYSEISHRKMYTTYAEQYKARIFIIKE